ncbi:LLM class F420-dependent oxidoreductase [Microbacterium sp. bgisy207]|jgi:F420-dependent oxidoreductase-like protein|uniref:LLM class F420-dependent oxidoreductase n=1 Tax=Microbacterium sp. bgisy207 TaxID=3413800 RepID=UPI003EB73E7E
MEYCIFTEPQQGFSYAQQVASAQLTERHGFDGWFRSDHYLAMGDGDPLPGPTDAWTTLAGLARETERVRLGTLVSPVTFRHPGVLAIQVAQVDEMSNGRAELGLGAGWFAQEHSAYGIPFPSRRFGLLEEQLAIVTGLWQTPVGSTFDFDGAHYRLERSPALPKPIQSPVPVIVGGAGPARTPALAALFATEFNIGFQHEDRIAESFARVRAACEQIDRDPDSLRLSVALPTVVAHDDVLLDRRLAAIGRERSSVEGEAMFLGGREQIAAKVERLASLGASRIYFQQMDLTDLEQLDELGTEILPHLPR